MGPWSRSFIAAVAGNVDRPVLEVESLRVDPGTIRADVDGCEVTITAAIIPPRIWAAMVRYAKGMGQLEDAVAGKLQSVHLEHLLEEDWDEVLVPRARSIRSACSCDADAGCEHVAAVAYAFADQVESSPRLLLRWRGVGDVVEGEASESDDPWTSGREFALSGAPRSMPSYAVLKRLGPSVLAVSGGDDLADELRVAYRALVASSGS